MASGQTSQAVVGRVSRPHLWSNRPQRLHDYTGIEQSLLQDWDDRYMSQDMLKLNVWTPALTGNRPVLVYFHGRGFTFGSSYELPSY